MVIKKTFLSYYLLLIWLHPSVGHSENIIPNSIEYSNDSYKIEDFQNCGVDLTITNVPKPEALKVKLFLMNNNKNFFYGISLNVAEFVFVNNIPKSLKGFQISKFSFFNNDYNSDGRLNNVVKEDGGIMKTAVEVPEAKDLMENFFYKSFKIEFSRQNSTSLRTYIINQSPPEAVVQEFLNCAKANLNFIK